MPEVAIPKLTIPILKNIVTDAAKLSPHITAVGLVGSYARGQQQHCSDVDLIVKTDNSIKFQAILESFGEYVHHVLDYQFNKKLDLVRYDLVEERANRDPHENETWFYREGFTQMLNEVEWLYEKG